MALRGRLSRPGRGRDEEHHRLVGQLLSERSASNFRQGEYTSAHVQAMNVLGLNGIWFLSEQVIWAWGNFDSKGRAIAFKCDILINDANFGAGVIEIDGQIHTKLSKEHKDEK